MRSGVVLDAWVTRALHRAAWLALRVQSPLAARRTVRRLASAFRPFSGVAEAREAGRVLSGKGTCLSRSLAISARLPGSEVVLEVDVRRSAALRAHAWVELGSDPVLATPPVLRGETIARF